VSAGYSSKQRLLQVGPCPARWQTGPTATGWEKLYEQIARKTATSLDMRYSNNDLKPKTEWEKTKRMTNNVQMANKTAIKMNGNNNKKNQKRVSGVLESFPRWSSHLHARINSIIFWTWQWSREVVGWTIRRYPRLVSVVVILFLFISGGCGRRNNRGHPHHFDKWPIDKSAWTLMGGQQLT
jgi:hypothetical protein